MRQKMNFPSLLLYTAGAMMIIISPGPDFIYVISRGMSQGRSAGLYSALGISLGLTVHTALAALGLSALLSVSGAAFWAVKIAGAAYLFYLGVKMLLKRDGFGLRKDGRRFNKTAIVRQGVLTNVFNPKAVLTFMAFIPQFIDPSDGTAALRIVLMGGILAFLAMLWFGLVGCFAGAVGEWISRKPFYGKLIQRLTGCVLIALGLRLALMKRSAR
jgi:threonine/homoserine/homoserine lactone efflux protein